MSEIRRNPFSDNQNEWTILSSNRLNRPWPVRDEKILEDNLTVYDKDCAICPGNIRQNGDINPNYKSIFVFVNDNPVFLTTDMQEESREENLTLNEQILFQRKNERGVCKVVVHTPEHNKTMKDMQAKEISKVIQAWGTDYQDLGALPYINHVAEFETRGRELGNSLIHSHSQIWAQEHIPPKIMSEINAQKQSSDALGKNAMIAYLNEEMVRKERLVYANEHFGVVVPFWALWPYETIIIPFSRISSINELTGSETDALAKVLSILSRTYAILFERPINGAPYMLGIHQVPTDNNNYIDYQMHLHMVTPLMSANRLKYPAGYGEFFGLHRDVKPEESASKLRTIAENLNKD